MITSQRDWNGMTDNALHNAPMLTASEFFSRAQRRLTFDVPAGLADPHVIPRHDDHADPAVVIAIAAVRPIRPAAVLVPIIERGEPSVLFTQRTAHLADHPGQISFPGGKIDASDESPAAAALREAEEEIALCRYAFLLPFGAPDDRQFSRAYMALKGWLPKTALSLEPLCHALKDSPLTLANL